MADHRVRPTEGCSVLNTQLKTLSARVKTMERQSAKMEALTQLMTIRQVASMLLSAAPNATAAAELVSLDPVLMLQIAGAGEAQALLDALPGDSWRTFNADLTLANQTLVPFEDSPAPGSDAALQNQLPTCQTISMNFSGPGGGSGDPGPGSGDIDGGTF